MNYVEGKNKILWRFISIILVSIILSKSGAVKDIFCNTYYEEISWTQIAGKNANAVFSSIELIDDGPPDRCRYGIGILSNGKKIIVCYRYYYTEAPSTDVLAQGVFYVPYDKEVQKIAEKYNTEYMVFRYFGANYFETNEADYIILGIGLIGLALCMILALFRKLGYNTKYVITLFANKKNALNVLEIPKAAEKHSGGFYIPEDATLKTEKPEIQETEVNIQEKPEIQEIEVNIQEKPEIRETEVKIQGKPEIRETEGNIQEKPEIRETEGNVQERQGIRETEGNIQEKPEIQETAGKMSENKKSNKRSSKRDSNFEILRIICIFMVIMQHFGFWGKFDISGDITANTIILQTIVNFGKVGVNCFMLITGYYMINSEFKFSKVLKLAGTVWFYSWSFGVIFILWNYHTIDFNTFIKTIFPITTGQYWFITIYLIIYALSPMLNGAAKAIGKEKYRNTLVFLYVLWTIMPILPIELGWSVTNIGWMMLMYLTGSYIRLYGAGNKEAGKYLFNAVFTYILLMLLTLLWDSEVGKVVYQRTIAQKENLFIVLPSLYLFAFFSKIKVKQSKIINRLASCSFAVYLIHENFIVKKYLWTDWLEVNKYFSDNHFGLYAAGIIILVYTVCIVIELIRQCGMSLLITAGRYGRKKIQQKSSRRKRDKKAAGENTAKNISG